MYYVDQCSNCGLNVSRELGVVTPTTVQHRECADRFGVGTCGAPRTAGKRVRAGRERGRLPGLRARTTA